MKNDSRILILALVIIGIIIKNRFVNKPKIINSVRQINTNIKCFMKILLSIDRIKIVYRVIITVRIKLIIMLTYVLKSLYLFFTKLKLN